MNNLGKSFNLGEDTINVAQQTASGQGVNHVAVVLARAEGR